MSDEIRAEIKAVAKALCHYPSGPSAVNSCCPGIGRCEMDAAINEIAHLRAAFANARREGMEAMAEKAIQAAILHGKFNAAQRDAIRAALEGGKDV